MTTGLEPGMVLVALGEAFARFCGYAPGTPLVDIIGQPAIDLIVGRARKWLIASLVSFVLWIVVGISAIRFSIGLLSGSGLAEVSYHLLVAAASALLARFLMKTRHEPARDELLATAECDEHRLGISKLEEFLDLAGTEAMPAVEDVPERPEKLSDLPQIGNVLFRSDNGRLLLVRPDLFWLVRSKVPKPVAPILIWFDECKFNPPANVDDNAEALPDTEKQSSDGHEETDDPELSWLLPLDEEEIEQWHSDYWPKRPNPGPQDDPKRDSDVFFYAHKCVREPRHRTLTKIADCVLAKAQSKGNPITLANETISRMLGWSHNEQHRKYTGFRDYAIGRLKSEGRWPPRKPGEQLQLFRPPIRRAANDGGAQKKSK